MVASEFDAFYQASARRLLRFAYAMCGDLAEAQDLTQEAYARCWQHWDRVRTYPYPETWVRTVITRLATDRWRALAVRRRSAGASRPPVAPSPSVAPSVAPSASPSPIASPSSPAANVPPPATRPHDCTASDMDSHAYYRTGAAMGTHSYEITVRNGAQRCRLVAPPVLSGVDRSTGARRLIPLATGPDSADRSLAKSAYAEFSVRYGANNYGPSPSECASPPDYSDIAIVFPDGSQYALPRIHLVSECTGFTVFGWLDWQYPAQPGAYKPAD